jgi:hypothetical protein
MAHRMGRAAEIDRAVLVVGALVTNVVRHTVSDPRLTVAAQDGVLRCSVHDASAARPVSRQHDVSAETGRGMWLVAALSSAWGVGTFSPPGLPS